MKVPDGWEKTSLGKIFEFKNGVNAEKSSYGQGIKFINVMDIFQGNFILAEKILGQIEEQKQIAETLSTAQQEIDLLKQLSEKYKTQKRGLMQKLLTGEWRVKPEILKKV